jgi:hypothetical protein
VSGAAGGRSGPGDPLAALAAVPEVEAAVITARDAVDRLLSHRMLRRNTARIAAETALRGARASAALEGEDVPLEELRAGQCPLPLVQGALRASAEVGTLVTTWQRAPLQALARLHVLAAGDLLESELLGRPRPDATPESTARLRGVAALAASRAPGILVAAVVHGELLAAAPFAAANGLVARAAHRIVLIARGVDRASVSAPDVGYLDLADEYLDVAQGYAQGSAEGVLAWVQHCCRAVERGAQEGLAICEALQRG